MEFQVKGVFVLLATIVAFAIIGGSYLKREYWPQRTKFAYSLPGYSIK
jgi:hypothetical protein